MSETNVKKSKLNKNVWKFSIYKEQFTVTDSNGRANIYLIAKHTNDMEEKRWWVDICIYQ